MVKPKTALRGEVWLTELDPIVSPDAMNRFLQTIVGMPLTSGGSLARFRVPVRFKGKAGLLLGDQLRTLDRSRLIKRLGVMDVAATLAALALLREMFEE
jgi:mRNA interferase MazF